MQNLFWHRLNRFCFPLNLRLILSPADECTFYSNLSVPRRKAQVGVVVIVVVFVVLVAFKKVCSINRSFRSFFNLIHGQMDGLTDIPS